MFASSQKIKADLPKGLFKIEIGTFNILNIFREKII